MANRPEEIPMNKSECQAVQAWTFSALVGAFLDLVIAYLLLCASTAAYLTAKFLSIFGLSLPCPRNGLFGFPESTCIQRELVDGPLEKISSVQTSVRNKFPFNSMWVHGESPEVPGKKHFEQKGEASYSSYSNDGGDDDSAREYVTRNEKRRGSNLKRKLVLRQRRRIAAVYEKSPLACAHDTQQSDVQDVTHSSSRSDVETNKASLLQSISDSNDLNSDKETSKDILDKSRALDGRDRSMELVSEKLRKDWPRNIGIGEDAIKLLGQALEEEHAARVALHLELERERSAAATATDEALAMILRLQEEKASVEMEARQYQREIEEKSMYDAEEMNILKEILLRREREKHFLENELEFYKHAIFANEETVVDSDIKSTASTHEKGVSSFYSPEKLEQITKALDKDITRNPTPTFGNTSDISRQGSGMLPIGDLYKLHFQEGKDEEGAELEHEKVIMPIGDREDQHGNPILSEGLASNFSEAKTVVPTNKDSAVTASDDAEVIVHDVHVSGDEPGSYSVANATPDIPSTAKTGPEINRSGSDCGLPPIPRKGSVSNLRRNSMSAVDYERMNIDSEVEMLMERLKMVRMGKEKLKVSSGDGDGGKTQLQLLHEIAIQLQEIKRWTYAGKNDRHAALPPSSSKQVKLRKARRSASVGVPPRST